MSKSTKGYILLTAVLVLAAFLIYSCQKSKNADEKKNVPSPGGMNVSGFVLKPEKLDNIIRTTGTITAFEEVELKAETSGLITKIYFKEGAHVKKGELLVKINDDDLQAQLKKSELQVKLAKEQENRYKQLLNINAASRQEYDIILNQLSTLQAEQGIVKAGISKTEIRSPFNGVIGLRYVSEGSYASPASRIASVQNINPVKIDFSIPEKYSGLVSKGDVVDFKSEETSQSFTGNVYAVEPKIDLSTRTLQVRAICENINEKIFPGSFVKIELRLKETPDALLIPTQALIPVLKGQTVFISKNGIAQSVPVKTGVRTDVKVQITEGLTAGDTVITTGIMQIKPNTPVKVSIK